MKHTILPRMISYRVMHTDYIHTHVHTLNIMCVHMCTIPCNPHLTVYYHFRRFSCRQIACAQPAVLHGESITDQASPRTPTQRTFQPQEAMQPQRNQTILQADTPAQKANYSYKRSQPTPLEADAHTSHVHKNAPARTQSPGGRSPSTCTHRTKTG